MRWYQPTSSSVVLTCCPIDTTWGKTVTHRQTLRLNHIWWNKITCFPFLSHPCLLPLLISICHSVPPPHFPLFLSLRSVSLPTVYFLLSICSCRLSCESFRARTGSWVWTVLTCVTATTGKRTCRWSFSRTTREPTAGSRSLLLTSRPFHRTGSHRWVGLSQVKHPLIQSSNSLIVSTGTWT